MRARGDTGSGASVLRAAFGQQSLGLRRGELLSAHYTHQCAQHARPRASARGAHRAPDHGGARVPPSRAPERPRVQLVRSSCAGELRSTR
eukprot:1901073-Alexandrium_andersonii.AAC.1